MKTLSDALQRTEMACDAITELVLLPEPSGGLQAALEGMTKALSGLTKALQLRPPNPKPAQEPRVNEPEIEVSATELALDEVESAWNPASPMIRIWSVRSRALLLEIVKRAIHDWVLYKTHSEITKKTYAREAYVWLFEEDEDHPDFKAREEDDFTITSFLVICEATNLDPDNMRGLIRNLKPCDVMGTGRPAERRRRSSEDVSIDQHNLSGVSIEAFEPSPSYRHQTYLEQHYAPNLTGYA